MALALARWSLSAAILLEVAALGVDESGGKKYRTFYEGRWNPQDMVGWIKKHGLDPYEIYRALHLIKTCSVDDAAKRIAMNYKVSPLQIQIMLKELNIHVSEAYEALSAWIKDPGVTVAYRSGFSGMTPEEAQSLMKGEKHSSAEKKFDEQGVPDALDRLADLYKSCAWVRFNQEALKLREKIDWPKKLFRSYTPMQTWKEKYPMAFRALRRFFVRGLTAGPKINYTVTTEGPKIGKHTLGPEDWRDLHDIQLSDSVRYRLLYNETIIAELPVVEPFQKKPSMEIKNTRRYYDTVENKVVVCDKTIHHAEIDDGSNREIKTNFKYILPSNPLFATYFNNTNVPAGNYSRPTPKYH